MTEPLTELQVQSAWIAKLKAMPQLTSLMTGVSGTEIRENQWSGADFGYPAVRVYVSVFPSINGCGPDRAEITTEVFSEQKSSMQSKQMSGVIVQQLHKKRFKSSGLDFSMVRVIQEHKSEKSIYAWVTKIDFECLVN